MELRRFTNVFCFGFLPVMMDNLKGNELGLGVKTEEEKIIDGGYTEHFIFYLGCAIFFFSEVTYFNFNNSLTVHLVQCKPHNTTSYYHVITSPLSYLCIQRCHQRIEYLGHPPVSTRETVTHTLRTNIITLHCISSSVVNLAVYWCNWYCDMIAWDAENHILTETKCYFLVLRLHYIVTSSTHPPSRCHAKPLDPCETHLHSILGSTRVWRGGKCYQRKHWTKCPSAITILFYFNNKVKRYNIYPNEKLSMCRPTN